MRRSLAAIAGVGSLAVLVSAAIFRDELVVHYELRRLRSEEGYLLEALQRPEGTTARKAARQYLATPAGHDALLELFLASETDWLEEVGRGKGVSIMVPWTSTESSLLVWDQPPAGQRRRWPTRRQRRPSSPALLSAAREHLFRADERHTVLPEYPGLGFRCVGVPNIRGVCTIEEIPPAPEPLASEK